MGPLLPSSCSLLPLSPPFGPISLLPPFSLTGWMARLRKRTPCCGNIGGDPNHGRPGNAVILKVCTKRRQMCSSRSCSRAVGGGCRLLPAFRPVAQFGLGIRNCSSPFLGRDQAFPPWPLHASLLQPPSRQLQLAAASLQLTRRQDPLGVGGGTRRQANWWPVHHSRPGVSLSAHQ